MSRIVSVVAIVASVVFAGSAQAQSWAQKLFDETSHDFGYVARAANAEHVFTFKNTLGSPIQVSSVRASCGCAQPEIQTQTVQPGEEGRILVRFNTRSFKGQRGATITVSFSQPSWTEAQLRIDGYIRSDIVVDPGEVSFSEVIAGEQSEKTLTIKYAGSDNWEIRDIQSSNPNVSTQLNETRRGNGRIDYELKVQLDPAQPIGYLNDQLTLVTNDRNRKEFPIIIRGYVKPPIEVPSLIDLGSVKEGATVKKSLVVKGSREFTVLGISSNDPRIQLTQPTDKKKLHMLSLTLDTSKSGEVEDEVVIHTDDPGMPTATIRVMGSVVSDK